MSANSETMARTADPTTSPQPRRQNATTRVKLTACLFALIPVFSAPAAPIMVVIDLHADPMPGNEAVQQQIFQDWVDNTNWLLNITEPRGAKLSFLSTGQFMEWVLADPAQGHPLIQRLYASGGQIGTHSHNKNRVATHNWVTLPPNPSAAEVLQHWNDHVGAVRAVITAALGITDPATITAVNSMRGSHTPGDDAWRIQMMSDFGFTNHQQGPDEQLYAYFHHYPMNPYRPSSSRFLEADPASPVVVVPFGPVLGHNDVHFGIEQDMRMRAVQARFLLEVLNWLHDVHVAGTGRVWVTGWGSHTSDIAPGTVTRLEYAPTLNWLLDHFVDQPVGGQLAATFAGAPEARDAYLAWETSHPGETSFSYPADATDWDLYPYLIPAIRYLTQAWYEASMPPVGTVRWHHVTASADAGGPFPVYVAYTTDGVPTTVDLSPVLGVGTIAVVDPATGDAQIVSTTTVDVATIGTILVPPDKVIDLTGGTAIPSVSCWGMTALALLVLTAGSVAFTRKRRAA